MHSVTHAIGSRCCTSLTKALDTSHGQLRRVPNHVIALVVFLCANVVLQGVADLGLKILTYSSLLPVLPWRTDFLFLTAISVLMGYRTLTGMYQRKFDVTRNSIELGVLVETALIVGDSLFIVENIDAVPGVFLLRLPFIVLTSINVVVLVYVYHALNLRKWWCPKAASGVSADDRASLMDSDSEPTCCREGAMLPL